MSVAPGLRDRALGCFLGACVGDAAGAVLEFMGRAPTAAEVRQQQQHAVHLPTIPATPVFSGTQAVTISHPRLFCNPLISACVPVHR
jgi:hypothetical protein